MLGCPVPGCAGAAAGGPLQELADWRDEVPAAALAPGRAAAAEPRFLLACESCATLLTRCRNCRNLLALPAAWSEPAPPATAPSAGTASAGTAAPAALTHCTFCSLPHPLDAGLRAALDLPALTLTAAEVQEVQQRVGLAAITARKTDTVTSLLAQLQQDPGAAQGPSPAHSSHSHSHGNNTHTSSPSPHHQQQQQQQQQQQPPHNSNSNSNSQHGQRVSMGSSSQQTPPRSPHSPQHQHPLSPAQLRRLERELLHERSQLICYLERGAGLGGGAVLGGGAGLGGGAAFGEEQAAAAAAPTAPAAPSAVHARAYTPPPFLAPQIFTMADLVMLQALWDYMDRTRVPAALHDNPRRSRGAVDTPAAAAAATSAMREQDGDGGNGDEEIQGHHTAAGTAADSDADTLLAQRIRRFLDDCGALEAVRHKLQASMAAATHEAAGLPGDAVRSLFEQRARFLQHKCAALVAAHEQLLTDITALLTRLYEGAHAPVSPFVVREAALLRRLHGALAGALLS